MAKTRGAPYFRPRVRQGPTPPTETSTPCPSFAATAPSTADASFTPAVGVGLSVPTARPFVASASLAPIAVQSPAAGDAEGSSSMAPAQRRYHTRVGPTPPAPSHPKPAWRAPPAKRARTSSPGESSTSRSRAPPSPPYQGISGAPDLSPASIIRRPYFPYDPIPGMLSTEGEISMGRCTTISQHFP